MQKKIRVALIYGGKSAEHEISLRSAQNVRDAINPKKYDVVSIKIEKNGKWERSVIDLESEHPFASVDVVFPILHGPMGEDGTMQGLLKIANVPYVGPDVLGSAIGMDKDVMKRLLRDAGIPITRFITIRKGEKISFTKTKKELGLPLFIKPANMGSSVGVSKVTNEREFIAAIADAFRYDIKVLIEECIIGREIECGVLGNEDPLASVLGELVVNRDFYSYEAKYVDEHGATPQIPANIPKKTQKKIQNLAVQTFKALACEGMSRVDFFLKEDGTILVNEINTIPGFTNISMYPRLWEASGVSYSKLIDTLIQLAIARFKRDAKLSTVRREGRPSKLS